MISYGIIVLIAKTKTNIQKEQEKNCMATKSPITNDEIKTKPTNSSFRNGWERAFLKKPQEWLDSYHPTLFIKSRDGFRDHDGDTWEKPMKKSEFEYRLSACTLLNLPL